MEGSAVQHDWLRCQCGAVLGKAAQRTSGSMGGSDDEDSGDEEAGPLDSKQLNAETQRILRGRDI